MKSHCRVSHEPRFFQLDILISFLFFPPNHSLTLNSSEMTTKVGLHSNQPNSPSLLARILSPLTPFLITAQLLSVGLLPAILAQLKSLNPFKILNPWQWRDEILAAGMGSL